MEMSNEFLNAVVPYPLEQNEKWNRVPVGQIRVDNNVLLIYRSRAIPVDPTSLTTVRVKEITKSENVYLVSGTKKSLNSGLAEIPVDIKFSLPAQGEHGGITPEIAQTYNNLRKAKKNNIRRVKNLVHFRRIVGLDDNYIYLDRPIFGLPEVPEDLEATYALMFFETANILLEDMEEYQKARRNVPKIIQVPKQTKESYVIKAGEILDQRRKVLLQIYRSKPIDVHNTQIALDRVENRDNSCILFGAIDINTQRLGSQKDQAIKVHIPQSGQNKQQMIDIVNKTLLWNMNFSPVIYLGRARIANVKNINIYMKKYGDPISSLSSPSLETILTFDEFTPDPTSEIIDPEATYGEVMAFLPNEKEFPLIWKNTKDKKDRLEILKAGTRAIVDMQSRAMDIEETDIEWGSPGQLLDKLKWNLGFIDEILDKSKQLEVYQGKELGKLESLFSTLNSKALAVFSPDSKYTRENDFELLMSDVKHYHGDTHWENMFIRGRFNRTRDNYTAYAIDCVMFSYNPKYYNIHPLSDFAMYAADTVIRTQNVRLKEFLYLDFLSTKGYVDDERNRRVFNYYFLEKLWAMWFIKFRRLVLSGTDRNTIRTNMKPNTKILEAYVHAFDPIEGIYNFLQI